MFESFEQTIIECTDLMMTSRAIVTKYDMFNLINVCGGLFVFTILAVVVGFFSQWWLSFLFILIYLCLATQGYFYTKRKTNKHLRIAYLILALYCRAENNRTYLKKKIRLRPGYLAKWIEFQIEDSKKPKIQIEEAKQSKARKVRDRA